MRIIPITLPTPFPVGPVNVYLVADDPVTLIDTGPKTREALAALREGLRKAAFRVFDIRRIVLTHTHEDHCGLARTIRSEAHDVEIFVHDWETGHLAERGADDGYQALLVRGGVPKEVMGQMRGMFMGVRAYGETLEEMDCRELKDGEEIQFASGALRVVHTPGHTPGSCSLLREADRTVVAGDTVLKRITPNPILSPDPVDPRKRFRSLEEYLVSLSRLRSFAPTLVYGGHGEPVTDYEEIFNRYVRHVRERQAGVIGLVSKEGVTAWDIAGKLFPDLDDLVGVHHFLAVSEAVAHLDLAHSEGKIAVELSQGREIYHT
ncbi:MAG: MBL fold metallo-hydrolase [Pyrinomonadaceae bacterium]|nr:MBL fold metallo-hydrolase [Pyrinomonadaceae bacterium]